MALTKIDDRGLKTPIDLLDNEKIRFGTGNDLEIYHEGSNSWIRDLGTGSLVLSGSTVQLKSGNGAEACLKAFEDGAVELYYDNVKKFETTSTGTKTTGKSEIDGDVQWNGSDDSWGAYWDKSANSLGFKDNKKITLGTGNDLEIYHNGTSSYISNSTGNFALESDGYVWIGSKTGTETYIKGIKDGAVELYHDNVKKLNTGSGGIVVSGSYYTNDDNKIYLGSDNDLALYHDATNTYITNSTGQFAIQGDDLKLRSKTDLENYVVCTHNGSVELYYNGDKTLSAESARVDIKQRVKINNDGPNSGDGMAIGQWDGSNHRIEGDSNRPMYLTSYNSSGIKMGVSGGVTATVIADGITFNNDTAAANALDDYEEGSWTPAFASNQGQTPTHATQTGQYTKIGNWVHVQFYCSWTACTNMGTEARIGGLPFTSSEYGTGSCFLNNWNFNSEVIDVVLHHSGHYEIYLYYTRDDGSWQALNTDSNAAIIGTMSYKVSQ